MVGFCRKINDCDKEEKKSFDGVEAEIGDVKIVVTKYFMAKVTGIPMVREIWFKKRGIEGDEWRIFLKKIGMDTSVFKKGIPSIALKRKWRNLLLVIEKLITCEGIFDSMIFYHICSMMHFLEGNEINLPYLLLNILKKMINNTQRKIHCIENTMYRHGLIKMLIEATLKNIGDDWEIFLVRNHL